VVAEKRFTDGYQFLAHYTWSKALRYDSGYYRSIHDSITSNLVFF